MLTRWVGGEIGGGEAGLLQRCGARLKDARFGPDGVVFNACSTVIPAKINEPKWTAFTASRKTAGTIKENSITDWPFPDGQVLA